MGLANYQGRRLWRVAPSSSCPGPGRAWRSTVGGVFERRARVIGALVVRRKRGPARRSGFGWRPISVRPSCAESAAPGTKTHRRRTRPDCRQPNTCIAPSRPCISGRPGRIATFQNDSPCPPPRRPLHEIVVADRSAAGGHKNVGIEHRARPAPRSSSPAACHEPRRDR